MSGNINSNTPIAYYGGKISLLSHILPMIPPHNVYTETFFGGGAVFFVKEKSKNETINDKLDICVNFYRTIKIHFSELKKEIDSTLMSRRMHNEALEIFRNPDNYSDIKKAWAFWLTCNFSFGNKPGAGIKYSNHQTTVVVEQMKNKKRNFTDWLVHRLEDAFIENTDAKTCLLSRNVPTAFHYLDPPYFNADMGHYGHWTEADLIELLNVCELLSGKFLLSNYNSDVLNSFIQKNGWYKKEIPKRLMAPKIKNRDKIEVLVSNYTISDLIINPLFKSESFQ